MSVRNIMIVGVGGQGTLLASKLLGRLLLVSLWWLLTHVVIVLSSAHVHTRYLTHHSDTHESGHGPCLVTGSGLERLCLCLYKGRSCHGRVTENSGPLGVLDDRDLIVDIFELQVLVYFHAYAGGNMIDHDAVFKSAYI